MAEPISKTDDERCEFHYYLYGGPTYPAFMCGLPKDHEGEHKDISKIYLEKMREKYHFAGLGEGVLPILRTDPRVRIRNKSDE